MSLKVQEKKDSYKEVIEAKSLEAQKLLMSLGNAEKQAQNLREQVLQKTGEVLELQNIQQQLDFVLKGKNREIENCAQKINDLTEENRSMLGTIGNLKERVNNLEHVNNSLQASELVKSNNHSQAENAIMKQKIQYLESLLSQKDQQIQNQEQTIGALRAQVHEQNEVIEIYKDAQKGIDNINEQLQISKLNNKDNENFVN